MDAESPPRSGSGDEIGQPWLESGVQPSQPAPLLRFIPHLSLAFGVLAIFVLWLVIGLGVQALERAERDGAARVLANLCRSFEGHVERSLRNIDHILSIVAREAARQGSAPDLAELLGQPVEDDALFSHLAVTDADGRVLAATGPGFPASVAAEDYFLRQRERPDGGLLVSAPSPGRGGQPAPLLSQRIARPDGSFAGVAVAAVTPDYFTRFYSGFELGEGGVVALLDRQGNIRASYVRGDGGEGVAADLAAPSLLQAMDTESAGSFRGAGGRVYAFRAMAAYPFAVVVGMTGDHAFAALAQRERDLFLLGSLVSLVVVVLSGFLFRQSRLAWRAEVQACRAVAQLRLNAKVFEESSDGIVICDGHNRILAVNRAFTDITGYALAEVAGRNPRFLASGATPPETYQDMWRCLREEGCWRGEVVNRRKDGEKYPEWLSVSAVKSAGGSVTHYIGIFSDATLRKFDSRRLHFLVHYDALTELPNRLLLTDRLGQALAAARRSGAGVAVLFIDLDNFKEVNDRHGHAMGDRFLQAMAGRLRAAIRESDTLARFGGDEFVLVVPEMESEDYAERVAEKCRAAFDSPFLVDGVELRGSASIGIALYPQDGEDGGALIAAADRAMYEAKEDGRAMRQPADR